MDFARFLTPSSAIYTRPRMRFIVSSVDIAMKAVSLTLARIGDCGAAISFILIRQVQPPVQ